jgi:two-component system, chemotaxis family, chemotaxis protein CheY
MKVVMKKILIIDDSESTRSSLTFYLSLKKYTVVTAANGSDGYKMLTDPGNEIGLVITDMNMPVMNGEEFVRKLRADPQFQKLPVIMLTTDEVKGNESLDFGTSAFILKSSTTAEEIIRYITTYTKWEN